MLGSLRLFFLAFHFSGVITTIEKIYDINRVVLYSINDLEIPFYYSSVTFSKA